MCRQLPQALALPTFFATFRGEWETFAVRCVAESFRVMEITAIGVPRASEVAGTPIATGLCLSACLSRPADYLTYGRH